MKILVPIDGSDNALLAVKYAGNMANLQPDVHITLMYVITFEPYSMGDASFIEKSCRSEAEEALAHAEEVLDSVSPTKPDHYIGRGFSAADQILEVAESEKFDTIVMGSRGLSDLKRFFIGSVSTRVSQHAPCTVILVK